MLSHWRGLGVTHRAPRRFKQRGAAGRPRCGDAPQGRLVVAPAARNSREGVPRTLGVDWGGVAVWETRRRGNGDTGFRRRRGGVGGDRVGRRERRGGHRRGRGRQRGAIRFRDVTADGAFDGGTQHSGRSVVRLGPDAVPGSA
eukprot:ctg_915.g447